MMGTNDLHTGHTTPEQYHAGVKLEISRLMGYLRELYPNAIDGVFRTHAERYNFLNILLLG